MVFCGSSTSGYGVDNSERQAVKMMLILVLAFLPPALSFDPFSLEFTDIEQKNQALEKDVLFKNFELKNLGLEKDLELKKPEMRKLPPYGIPLIPPEVAAKEFAAEEVAKEFSFEKAWPWLEKEFAFDEGVGLGVGIGKEMEVEKFLGYGIGKEIGYEKAAVFPWAAWEKYFGLTRKITFEQALALELFKRYSYYGFWIVLELRRRFALAKELGLIGQEIALQEAINIGLFKGIGLDKAFEASLKAIGIEKAAEASKEFSFDKIFGLWKRW